MISLGVQNSQVLTGALSRIHDAFIARGNNEMRRELLNTDIFLIPVPRGPFAMMMGGMSSEPWAFAVPGGNLVVGSVSGVEQEIRDLRRKDLEPIEADPMYRHAATALPDRAGAWFYSNQQVSTEVLWEQVKQAARTPAPAPAPGRSGDPTDFRRLLPTLNGAGGGMSGPPGMSPANILVYILRDYCDFNALPDFQAVKKHFGPTIGYVKTTDDGIYFEMLGLKAPAEKPQTSE
jgi:hypothetical protein